HPPPPPSPPPLHDSLPIYPDTDGPQGVIFTDIDLDPWPDKCVIPDYLRLSGSFNILATLKKADRLLEQIEPGLPLADRPLVIYRSEEHTSELQSPDHLVCR